jgi:hypothetical protein
MSDKYGKQLTQINSLLAGFTKAMPGGATTFVMGGTSYTQSALLTVLSGAQGILAAVPAAELAHAAALQAREENADQISAVIDNTTTALRGGLGSSPTSLASYGVKPYKEPTPLTSEQEVAKTQKAAATRKARGTLSKKQKAAIHGTVPVAAPAPAPTTPTPAVTPKGP